ncbi:KDP operon transcriptional regulatory protein KdpE [Ferriphaselus amnicola]|uniref:KDP operon transcriptional regulatory protein KdpE n=1 Tax=Ferriphaselus amnicola TaxID=1188319 RepID=A0A2Z6GDQ2_9PROT|nr:response regulator [Ferriphaselus amnicola]BBE51656.1 KDP operon transcriptional regulatory protein KdpE [Ferriphaselus amnicola]
MSLVLLVEDEREIRRFVRQALEGEGCEVREAGTMALGLEEVVTLKPQLVILDLGLPDGDGVDFVQRLRSWSQIPVLVLSARSTERDKIAVLDAGADDYLTKPFSVGELLARVRALLRRGRSGEVFESPLARFGSVEVDLARHSVTKHGQPVRLTAIEFKLLSVLLANSGRVLTHRQLLREVWGATHIESTHYLRIYVAHLRQKLEDDPTQPAHFQTEIGIGYRFQF